MPLVHLEKWITCSPVDEILAAAMDTGVAATLIHLRQAGGVIVALWAQAGEAVNTIDTSAPVVTRVDGAFIDVDVTHCSYKKRKTLLNLQSMHFYLDLHSLH